MRSPVGWSEVFQRATPGAGKTILFPMAWSFPNYQFELQLPSLIDCLIN